MFYRFKKPVAVFLTVCMVFALTACNTGKDQADIIITNAAVFTVNADDSVADAVSIKDGKIVYVGDTAGAEKFAGEKTRIVDMGGGTVMPGMVDSHMHPAMSACSYLYEIGLHSTSGINNYLKIISDFVKENPELSVYTGSGYQRSVFGIEGPKKEMLDNIEATKPIILTSVDGHSIWANSKALEMSGITKETPDPEGGVIQRDSATGEPSGLLQESAMSLVADLKPEYTKEQYKEAILWLQEWFNSVGLTTIFDAMVDIDNPNYYDAYQELAAEGKLTLRIRGGWHMYPEMGKDQFDSYINKGIELSKGFTTPYFQVNAFKFFADQVIEEETGYLSEPYSNRTDGWRGIKVWDDDVLADLYTKIDKEGFQLHTHQIGDAAAAYALDAIEKAVAANSERDSRHTFAHVQMLSDKDADRMAKLKMNAVIAPYWMNMDDYYWELYYPMLGKDRVNNMYPAKSLMEKGINTAVHCDFFVTEPDPGWLFYSAMTRTVPQKILEKYYGEDAKTITRTADVNYQIKEGDNGPLPQGSERLTLEEAVRAATYNGAYANFMEKEVGSIEVGKSADIIAFPDNIFQLDVEDVSTIMPVMTIFDGKIVYEKK
ncbi:MAG: amidohydrolase [Bacillota bacterium]